MNLWNPSAGAIVDRMTILQVKMSKIVSVAKVLLIKKEHATCLDAIMAKQRSLSELSREHLYELVENLYQQNVHQWEVEDAIRVAIKGLGDIDANENIEDLRRVARIAEASARGNEERAELIKAIDEMFGEVPEFKSYCGGASWESLTATTRKKAAPAIWRGSATLGPN
jgi:hypothetical protein